MLPQAKECLENLAEKEKEVNGRLAGVLEVPKMTPRFRDSLGLPRFST